MISYFEVGTYKCLAGKVFREIFQPKKDEVGDHFNILHNEDLGDLSGSPNIIRIVTSVMQG
jgi:hypothetical protein